MLFYSTAEAFSGSYFGRGRGDILLDNVDCNGDEESLADCSHEGWGQHDCHRWEHAGVRCYFEHGIGVFYQVVLITCFNLSIHSFG